ncbi:hypothetical protein [Nostoc sphaeroides]|uniref:Uncharacterized protein n=1 Tax=Nostoc sphaeroides CCNUC1 TaxID=2653204 RepID=A0A5P8WK27_9NOSO|nr:hypothetical protein [Nostoc sphaeroides]QFS52802.1 hypothetical protein GXM_10066 [Nostoc sphaeroides CCNUC1]
MPRQVVRNPAMGVNGLVKATNPYKPFGRLVDSWGLRLLVGCSAIAKTLRSREQFLKTLPKNGMLQKLRWQLEPSY